MNNTHKYTKRVAEGIVHLLNTILPETFIVVGSLSKKGTSNTDIDLLIIPAKRNGTAGDCLIETLTKLLKAEKTEITDWGGVYFTNTSFGDIDIFHSDKDGFQKPLKNGTFNGYYKNYYYNKAQKILKKKNKP